MIISRVTLFNEMLSIRFNAIGSIVATILTQSQFYLIKLLIFNMAFKDKAFSCWCIATILKIFLFVKEFLFK